MVYMAANAKRRIWIAPGTMESGVRRFGTPVAYDWNWRSLSSDADMQAFGPDFMDYRRATPPNGEVVGLKRFDRVWMDYPPSDPTDPLAKDADYQITGVDQGAGGVALVLFKRLSADA